MRRAPSQGRHPDHHFDAAQAKAFREKAYDIAGPVRSRPAPEHGPKMKPLFSN